MSSILTYVFPLSGGGGVDCQGDAVVLGSVGTVCKLKGVQGVRKGGADVGSDEPLEALDDDDDDGGQCYRAVVIQEGVKAFFGTGTMVVCLKQVGTADWHRERLNIKVNMSSSWSVHPLRTRPGMPPWRLPCVYYFKSSPHVSRG